MIGRGVRCTGALGSPLRGIAARAESSSLPTPASLLDDCRLGRLPRRVHRPCAIALTECLSRAPRSVVGRTLKLGHYLDGPPPIAYDDAGCACPNVSFLGNFDSGSRPARRRALLCVQGCGDLSMTFGRTPARRGPAARLRRPSGSETAVRARHCGGEPSPNPRRRKSAAWALDRARPSLEGPPRSWAIRAVRSAHCL